MKRLPAILLALTLLLTFTACDDDCPDLETGDVAEKPVIYLYPERTTEITVRLDYAGELTCTYPQYDDGWTVTAEPDGTLYSDGREYSYLFWEGSADIEYDFSRGFCVRGEDTLGFLLEALPALGLTPLEYNDFIVLLAAAYAGQRLQSDFLPERSLHRRRRPRNRAAAGQSAAGVHGI